MSPAGVPMPPPASPSSSKFTPPPASAGITARAAPSPFVVPAAGPPIPTRAPSASSGSSSVIVTSARPIGGRFTVPLKMQSAMRSARSDLWLCSPKTHEIASTTFDLPHPFGPTMQVVPIPANVTTVRSQKDLNPVISTFRSLSKVSPFVSASYGVAPAPPGTAHIQPRTVLKLQLRPEYSCCTHQTRLRCVFRREGVCVDRSAINLDTSTGSRSPEQTYGRFSFRGPCRLAHKMAVRETRLTRTPTHVKPYPNCSGHFSPTTRARPHLWRGLYVAIFRIIRL